TVKGLSSRSRYPLTANEVVEDHLTISPARPAGAKTPAFPDVSCQDFFQDLQTLIDLFTGNVQRRADANGIPTARQEEQPATKSLLNNAIPFRIGPLFRLLVANQFHPDHQAPAADLADPTGAALDSPQALLKICPLVRRISHQAFLLDDVQCRQAGLAGHGIAA